MEVMSMHKTPAPNPPASLDTPATIVPGAQGGWCCSACGGFVRHDAKECKYCHSAFDLSRSASYQRAANPTTRRTLMTLIGAGVVLLICSGGGFLIGAQFSTCSGFFPQLDCAFRGGLIGLALGSV